MSVPRRLIIIFTLVSFLVSGLVGVPFVTSSSTISQIFGAPGALAQTKKRKKRRTLFSILFGRKKGKRKSVRKKKSRTVSRRKKVRLKSKSRKKSKRKRVAVRSAKGKRRSVAKTVLAPILLKTESAKTILVVGDFFSGGLAKGLKTAFSSVTDIRVVDKSNGLSGFVRDDVVNWPVYLPTLLEEIKPAYLVVMLGSNDRQMMRENGAKLKKRTAEWDAAYKKRVESLGSVIKASGVPYFWVGLPPVRFKTMNTDFLVFNEIYSKAAQSPKGKFVDVWDGFSDADGNYSRSGPDVNGQIVLLRPKDGINLTKAGRQRLAFYVQGKIQKSISSDTLLANSSLAFDIESNLPKLILTIQPEQVRR